MMLKLVVAALCVASAYAATAAVDGKVIAILRSESSVHPEGYQYAYETENGIKGEEHGEIHETGKDQVTKTASGSFGWASPEGEHVVITYVADENGYQPQGDAIPTPPPTPVEIARALEYIAAHPQVEDKYTKTV